MARGRARSRAEAQALIAGGHVFAGETVVEKASQPVVDDAPLRVAAPERPRFVARGGLKLEAALTGFGVFLLWLRSAT